MGKTTAKVEDSRPRPVPDLHASELRLHQQQILSYVAFVAHGTTVDHVTRPTYWRNNWRILKKWATIRVICVDGSWEAELRVIDLGDAYARVRVLHEWHDDEVDLTSFPSDWRVEFVDPGWRIRNSDNLVISGGHATKQRAVEAGEQMVRKVVG